MFSSAVRSVLQTMLGVWLFADVLNANRVMSILLILAGSIVYTYLKSRPAPVKSVEDREKTKLMASDPEKGERAMEYAGRISRKPSPTLR